MDNFDEIASRIAHIRLGMGLTQGEFADALNASLAQLGLPNVTRGAVGNWESGGKGVAMRNMRALSEMSGASIDWIANNKGNPPSAELLRRIGERLLGTSTPAQRLARIPVIAQAAGSELTEGAPILFDQPPLAYLPMLEGLEDYEGVYCLEVRGTSMVPMFKPGDPVYVAPFLPPHPKDAAIIVEHHSKNGTSTGFIKIFEADRPDRVVTSQLNPPSKLEFMKKPGLSVHTVLDLNRLTRYRQTIGTISNAPELIIRGRRGPKR